MTNTRTSRRGNMMGFSLIELMIALVAGLIVVGSVLAFTVSSVSANSDFVKSAKLMQELRNVSNFITDELKRAGYDEAAMDYVANPSSTAVSRFAPILVDTTTATAHCIIYAYDRDPGTPGLNNRPGKIDLAQGEIRGIRRSNATVGGQVVGVVEVAESTGAVTPACNGDSPDYTQYPPACNASSGWCPLSDPRLFNLTAFTVSTTPVTGSNGYQTIAASSGFKAMQLREMKVALAGALRSDAEIARRIESNIKVRADCLRANVTSCSVAPAP